jgi:hypothetical protein
MRLEKPEVIQHRMAGKADFAVDLDGLGLGLHAVELDAVIGRVKRHAFKSAEKIEMPPGPAKLAVGGELEPDLLLPGDCFFDLAIFDRTPRRGGDLVARMLLARRFDRRRPQQAADMVGAKRRSSALHAGDLRATARPCKSRCSNSQLSHAEFTTIPDQRRSVSRCTASGIKGAVAG